MTIREHGESVWEHTQRLIIGDLKDFRLPDWFKENHHHLVNNLHDWEVIREYTLLHDCGKPFCVYLDEKGQRHFPNHAEVSKEKYLEAGGNPVVAKLIGLDMLFHTCNVHEIQALELNRKDLATLILVAFAEIHSNARAQGALDSTNFKIKLKKLCRNAKGFITSMNPHIDAHGYILVRKDLPPAQQAVQSAHAAWEASRAGHPNFVVLGVRNEYKLKEAMRELIDFDIKFKVFRDDIFDHEITAIMTEPLTDKRYVLSRYDLI